MKRATYTHPKLHDLMGYLGINRREAIGLLALIWDCTGQFAADIGDLGRMTDKFIAAYADWPEADAQRMITSLVKSHWLDEHPLHRLLVHDWQEHRERWVSKRVARSVALNGRPEWTPTMDARNGRPEWTTNPARLSSLPSPLPSLPSPPLPFPPITPPKPFAALTGAQGSNGVGEDSPPAPKEVPEPRAPVAGYPTDFEAFWKAYPRKAGKGAAFKAWQKTKATRPPWEKLRKVILNQESSDQWTKDGGQFIPMPATWLNQARWDDDLPEAAGEFGIEMPTCSPENALKINRQMWGWDWMADLSHVPVWTEIAAKAGMTPQEYGQWRTDWGINRGPYSPERPTPTVEPPSLEAK